MMIEEILPGFEEIEGWLSVDEADNLFALAGAVTKGCIVEVGSYRGRSTVALALGSQHGARAPVYAVEPHEEFFGPMGGVFGPEDRKSFFETMIRTGCYRSVRLVNLSSERITPGWEEKVGLLWIDGDHRYPAVARDIECWMPHLLPDAKVVFDDANVEDLGPRRVVGELVEGGGFRLERMVGKTATLRFLGHPGRSTDGAPLGR